MDGTYLSDDDENVEIVVCIHIYTGQQGWITLTMTRSKHLKKYDGFLLHFYNFPFVSFFFTNPFNHFSHLIFFQPPKLAYFFSPLQ